jgi:hypothetical protein
MTHEQIVAIKHLIHPGDQDREQAITFTLAELKTLQGIVVDRIQHDDEVHNAAYLPHRQLAEKLEYFIGDLVDENYYRAPEEEEL